MQFLRVKNFDRFQHYRDRAPPWIKLYNALLDDYAFGLLPDASKAHLLMIWLLASRHNNLLPADPMWIGQRINATAPVNLSALVSSGFLEYCDSASNLLAGCADSARAEREREVETEGEIETEKTLSAGADVGDGGPPTGAPSPEGAPDPQKPADAPKTGKPQKPPRKGKAKPPAKPEHAAFKSHFASAWKLRYGATYAWVPGKDDAHAKWILDQVDVARDAEKAKAIADAFLANDDPWLVDRRHTLGLLKSSFNRFAAAATDPDRLFVDHDPPKELTDLCPGPQPLVGKLIE